MSPAIAERTTFVAAFAANDNRPTDKEIDRWRLLIEGWRKISVSLALFATREKLSGRDFDEFAQWFLEAARREGWAV